MEIKDILKDLREKKSLTQEQLASRVMVTRQAVSRWETGETQPNIDTLKLLPREFDVSVGAMQTANLHIRQETPCWIFLSVICQTRII